MLLQLQLQLLVGCSHFLKFESGFEITSRHVIKSRYKILGLARWDVPGGDARAGIIRRVSRVRGRAMGDGKRRAGGIDGARFAIGDAVG